MTALPQSTRRKLSLLKLAAELGNVSKACQIMGNHRLLLVPFRRGAVHHELGLWRDWYNADRPHEAVSTRTADEVYFRRRPARRAPRLEPRGRWPR